MLTLSGELKQGGAGGGADMRRDSVSWESKLVVDRAKRKEAIMYERGNQSLIPFEKAVEILKDKLRKQLTQMTKKMQKMLQGRDAEILRRKEKVHRKLAKHVHKMCNSRYTLYHLYTVSLTSN
jgi:hypothetical protein